MPITRRQFELGINSEIEEWMQRIYEFLEERKEEAFSEFDLREAFNVPQTPKDYSKYNEWDADNRRFLLALERLVELNVANEREVSGISYYATGRYTLAQILN